LSLEYRPTAVYNFGSVLINAVKEACDRRGFEPRDVFASYKGVTIAGEPLSPRARALAESWGVELFEHGNVGDVTGSFECVAHDGLHIWEDDVFVEGVDHDGDRCELVATSLTNTVAPLIRYRSDDIVRLRPEACACGRTHARMWSVGRKSDEVIVDGRSVLPVEVWDAVESVDACALGLFQVIRPGRKVDRLRLRVGYAPGWDSRLDAVRDEVAAAVHERLGVEPDVELVPDAALLRLGPPHKIPRVAPR
jgi:phenylacetate-CoA ligase